MKKYIVTFALLLCAVLFFSCRTADTDPSGLTDIDPVPAAGSGETENLSAENDVVHPPLIAHAGGAVYGYRLTNSLEALNNSYENGFRVFELDFEVTSDGAYVLLHDWESMADRMLFRKGQMTLAEFRSAETFASLTLLSLTDLFDWLTEHEDCYIVTDGKCDNESFLTALSESAGFLSERFIPQTYSYEDYEHAKKLGFERVILTLYRMNTSEDELVAFAEKENPWAITIPMDALTTTLLTRLTELGIYTYTHTVNDLSFYEGWRVWGLHGIYTDYFVPVKWVY